ncbi:DUF1778 domain-containing protein [Microbispora sp. NPDC049633]
MSSDEVTVVPPEVYEAIEQSLDDPPVPNEALRRAAEEHRDLLDR